MRTDHQPRYRSVLNEFMSWRDEVSYGKDHFFSDEELGAITPVQLKRWCCFKVYGVADPQQDDKPTQGRSSSLEFYKKAISYYQPNRLIAWNTLRGEGNPTRSTEVNDLIKKIKKSEVRKEGAASRARRAMEKEEFEQVLEIGNNRQGIYNERFMAPTAMKFQFNMVARIDDTAHFQKEELKPNPRFDFTLLAQMCWSKNVLEERSAPDQILLGANNRTYCLLLAGAIHLEASCSTPEGLASPYLFGTTGNPATTSAKLSSIYKSYFDDEDFQRRGNGPLGSHSMRKLPATFARRNGCEKDDVNARGRWAIKKVVDRYIELLLPYPDAKVAAILAVGGPIAYKKKEGCNVSDNWLKEKVVSNMMQSQHIDKGVAMVFSLPLLWAAMDPEMESYMPSWLRDRIRDQYELIRRLPEGENPIKKVPLIVSGHQGKFF